MEIFILVLRLLAVAVLAVVFAMLIFNRIVEPAYILAYNRPVYVHLYFSLKKLSPESEELLQRDFPFYRNLSATRRKYFKHRVASFLNNYKFAGRNGLALTDDMKLQIAATAITLTFGMRNYLSRSFTTIILYPDVFSSANGEGHHKGEFNPLAGVVVFSWKHFAEGLQYNNDNLNLGLHEFAHVMHFDAMRRRRPGTSAVIYIDMFNEAMDYIANPENRKQLISQGYFRDYAYTNKYEFIAVLLEHFFETPQEFSQKFPELYRIVRNMINYR